MANRKLLYKENLKMTKIGIRLSVKSIKQSIVEMNNTFKQIADKVSVVIKTEEITQRALHESSEDIIDCLSNFIKVLELHKNWLKKQPYQEKEI